VVFRPPLRSAISCTAPRLRAPGEVAFVIRIVSVAVADHLTLNLCALFCVFESSSTMTPAPIAHHKSVAGLVDRDARRFLGSSLRVAHGAHRAKTADARWARMAASSRRRTSSAPAILMVRQCFTANGVIGRAQANTWQNWAAQIVIHREHTAAMLLMSIVISTR